MTESTYSQDYLELANAMADAVRGIVCPYFRQRLAVDAKADSSPVTIADREAETAMRKMIIEAFPEHGIRGEEFGVYQPEAEWVWVLDPIDGTKSFISGSLAFGTQIALLHNGVPVLGIIDQPITCERWLGKAGFPTVLNGEPIRTSDTRGMEQAIVYTSALEQFDAVRHRRFAALTSKARFTPAGWTFCWKAMSSTTTSCPRCRSCWGPAAWSATGRGGRSAMNAVLKRC